MPKKGGKKKEEVFEVILEKPVTIGVDTYSGKVRSKDKSLIQTLRMISDREKRPRRSL